MYVLTGESYSTTLRSAGVSAASTAARLGSMISPLFGFSVPAVASLLVWGIVLIIAGAITLGTGVYRALASNRALKNL